MKTVRVKINDKWIEMTIEEYCDYFDIPIEEYEWRNGGW